MILAGGRGSRLHDLTNKVAKPAVSYGGKYRIVDFPLSNCANSGVDVVGVLTQYESIQLNSYVAAGGRWGLDAKNSGVYVLPPREKADENLNVYRGTADAISQNIDFIDKFDPEYVLVLSGDHIYKMNYDKMLAAHKESKADATIAVIGVPMKEASRFGIMNTDESGRIVEFEEKPEHPKSNLASMGIYIFTWKLLRKMLMADIKNPDSSHDFGKDIIPTMLNDNRTLYAYKFEGYWKDVGTIDSLWEANMDLLDKKMLSDRPFINPAFGRKELAALAGLTPDELGAMIKNERSQTVIGYINACRAEEARRILESAPETAVATIATELGFGTPRTMQRVFRQHFGMSPTRFKELSKESKNR